MNFFECCRVSRQILTCYLIQSVPSGFPESHAGSRHSFYLFLKNVYLFEWQSNKREERVHLLILSPNAYISQGWMKPKPLVHSSMVFSPMVVGSPICGLSSTAFPDLLAGAASEVEQPGLEWALMGYWLNKHLLNLLCHMLALGMGIQPVFKLLMSCISSSVWSLALSPASSFLWHKPWEAVGMVQEIRFLPRTWEMWMLCIAPGSSPIHCIGYSGELGVSQLMGAFCLSLPTSPPTSVFLLLK